MSRVRTYVVIEGPIEGEVKTKVGKKGNSVTNIGFPIDTTEQPGMEHKDFWLQTVSFGGLGERLAGLPKGFNVHLEGHCNANRWLDGQGNEKASLHVIVEKAGELGVLGQQVKYFDIPRKKKEAKVQPDSGAEEKGKSKLTPEILEEARKYLQEHEQKPDGDLGILHSGVEDEIPGPGELVPPGASPG